MLTNRALTSMLVAIYRLDISDDEPGRVDSLYYWLRDKYLEIGL